MTKEEKIKEAWGINLPKKGVSDNGWSIETYHKSDINLNKYDTIRSSEKQVYVIRPKSLQGIENNNGWNSLKGIKNEIQHDGDIWIINRNGNIELWLKYQYLPIGYATHWKPVIKPKPPVY